MKLPSRKYSEGNLQRDRQSTLNTAISLPVIRRFMRFFNKQAKKIGKISNSKLYRVDSLHCLKDSLIDRTGMGSLVGRSGGGWRGSMKK